ncbi:glyceraldehyde 3-phosphate dehydrogenase [Leptodontidium sp. MPI-SDFR-AT-0119]|nr:glyceraldehyde 3-phosphate dehydrogenase [Leptodontidium sp. MPI-SDFR-AT-0119]
MFYPFEEFHEVDEILDDLDHTFKIGINGFGSLGRAIFCSSLDWPHVCVTAINDPFVDAKQAADILRGDDYRDSMGRFEIEAVSSKELIVRDVDTSRAITFCSEQDPADIGWKSPKLGVLHVIECSGKFVTFEEASRHLHTGRTFDQELEFEKEHGISIWEEGGAMKVLIASTSSGVPTFNPGVNERDCRFQDYVLGCDTPKHLETEGDQDWDLGKYSRQVLKLLNVVLARDGSLGSYIYSIESGRGGYCPGEKGPFLVHMERILASNIKGSIPRDSSDDDMIEIANSPSLYSTGPCGCCQGSRSWRRE